MNLKKLIRNTVFFFKESPKFVEGCNVSVFDYTRAYFRFMYFSRKDPS